MAHFYLIFRNVSKLFNWYWNYWICTKTNLFLRSINGFIPLQQYEEERSKSGNKLPEAKLEKEGTATTAPVYKFPYVRKR